MNKQFQRQDVAKCKFLQSKWIISREKTFQNETVSQSRPSKIKHFHARIVAKWNNSTDTTFLNETVPRPRRSKTKPFHCQDVPNLNSSTHNMFVNERIPKRMRSNMKNFNNEDVPKMKQCHGDDVPTWNRAMAKNFQNESVLQSRHCKIFLSHAKNHKTTVVYFPGYFFFFVNFNHVRVLIFFDITSVSTPLPFFQTKYREIFQKCKLSFARPQCWNDSINLLKREFWLESARFNLLCSVSFYLTSS